MQAEDQLKKLLKHLLDKQGQYDQVETEICLKNLIVVGNILKTDRDAAYKESLKNYIMTLAQIVSETDPIIRKIQAL